MKEWSSYLINDLYAVFKGEDKIFINDDVIILKINEGECLIRIKNHKEGEMYSVYVFNKSGEELEEINVLKEKLKRCKHTKVSWTEFEECEKITPLVERYGMSIIEIIGEVAENFITIEDKEILKISTKDKTVTVSRKELSNAKELIIDVKMVSELTALYRQLTTIEVTKLDELSKKIVQSGEYNIVRAIVSDKNGEEIYNGVRTSNI